VKLIAFSDSCGKHIHIYIYICRGSQRTTQVLRGPAGVQGPGRYMRGLFRMEMDEDKSWKGTIRSFGRSHQVQAWCRRHRTDRIARSRADVHLRRFTQRLDAGDAFGVTSRPSTRFQLKYGLGTLSFTGVPGLSHEPVNEASGASDIRGHDENLR